MTMGMNRLLAIAAIIAFAAPLAAQQPTFKSGVSLVTVDVTVIDKNGQPVPGLVPEDFEIKLSGKVQPIKALSFVQASNDAAAPAATDAAKTVVEYEADARHTFSNVEDAKAAARPAAPGRESRAFVILIDDLSFSALRGKTLFTSAQRFIDTIPAGDAVGMTTTSGSVAVNPTVNHDVVKAALNKVVGVWSDPRQLDPGGTSVAVGKGKNRDQPLGLDESIEIDRGNETLAVNVIKRECFAGQPLAPGSTLYSLVVNNTCAAGIMTEAKRTAGLTRQTRLRQLLTMTNVIGAMRGAAGIRHLVIITDGISVQNEINDIQPFTRAAASAGVQVSVIMEDPDLIDMNTTGRRDQQVDTGGSQRVREDNRLNLNGAQTVTDMVGGMFYRVSGQADASFAKILTASSAVYRLGLEAPSGTAPGKEMSVSVSLKKPGLTVRSNKLGITTDAAAAPVAAAGASTADALKAALAANTPLRALPVRAAASVRRNSANDKQMDVTVSAELAPAAKLPVTILIGVVDQTGSMRTSQRVIEAPGPIQFVFPLSSGNYLVRFGAGDASGALGTVEVPVIAKPRVMGPLTASDLLTWVLDAQNRPQMFAVDTPPNVPTLNASVELYPAGAMPAQPPVINWTVTRVGESRALLNENNQGRAAQNLFRADLAIPFDQLQPGVYTVRATLLVGDKPSGTVAATIRKR